MPPVTETSSAVTSQTDSSEEVTNQVLINVICDLQVQLTAISRRQNELAEHVLNLQRELQTRFEL